MRDTLKFRSTVQFDEMALDAMPSELRRNSLRHYYLSLWPPISHMQDFREDEYPIYPAKVSNIYLHIPFCSGACTFCNYYFNVIDPVDGRAQIFDYLEGVKREIEIHQERANINCSYIYIGGGTPSIIPVDMMSHFLPWLNASGIMASTKYGTIELHPEVFEDPKRAKELLNIYHAVGIQRVSLGVQTYSNKALGHYNRRHGTQHFSKAMHLIRDAGMVFNVDLMYGLPNHSYEDWETTLNEVISESPDSVSLYFLFLNGKTKLGSFVDSGYVSLPSYRKIQIMRLMAVNVLTDNGYNELPSDFFSKHALGSLADRSATLPSAAHTLPMGPGAYGFFDRTQFANHFSTQSWSAEIKSGKRPIWRGHRLSDLQLFRRDVMFSLKNSLGINVSVLAERWGREALEFLSPELSKLIDLGMLEDDEAGYRMTLKARVCAEEVASVFSPPLPAPQGTKGSIKNAFAHNFAPSYGK